MDGIYEWLRNVAVFFLLMTAVLNVLPEAKYRKYVQFFLGLVMLAVLCKPVLALGNLSDSLEQALERLTLEEEARGLRESQIRIDGLQQEVLYRTSGEARELKKELAEVYQVSEAHIIIRLCGSRK